MSRQDLLATARQSDRPEIAFEAWRLLGESNTRPAWPANPSELAAEVELHKHVASLIDKLRVPASRLGPTAMLHEQQAVRWRRVVEQASSESALASAWELRKPFEIEAPQLDAMSPAARFNFWMWRVRGDIERRDDTSLTYSTDQLKKAAGELKNQPAAVQLLAALTRNSAKEPFADQNPGDTFKVALLGAQPAVEFKRVAPEGQRPFYLSTSEVSLGQFASVIEAAGAWDACRRLPWAYEPGKPDLRRGPRVWEWIDGNPPRIGPAQLWLASESDNDFPIELRSRRFNRMLLSDAAGGNPSEQHPMQQVSAEAALWFAGLTGCRLPTATEWTAAYQQFEKGASPDQWNLRDKTWELQRGYVSAAFAALQPAQWPDEGIFRPEGLPIPTGHDARSRPNTDGVLFFRPAAAGGGSVFHHLMGNVGEYLCNAPEQFDALDKRSPESIRKFVQQATGQLAVIGGSALSPPELPLDKPLPLTRTDQCYSDVGFRLAFTAPAKSLAERTRWALQGQAYLWPAPSARAE
jgi:formylglycine-generating enzyme required for sulfatase activity